MKQLHILCIKYVKYVNKYYSVNTILVDAHFKIFTVFSYQNDYYSVSVFFFFEVSIHCFAIQIEIFGVYLCGKTVVNYSVFTFCIFECSFMSTTVINGVGFDVCLFSNWLIYKTVSIKYRYFSSSANRFQCFNLCMRQNNETHNNDNRLNYCGQYIIIGNVDELLELIYNLCFYNS